MRGEIGSKCHQFCFKITLCLSSGNPLGSVGTSGLNAQLEGAFGNFSCHPVSFLLWPLLCCAALFVLQSDENLSCVSCSDD